ncbi:hypothetical protein ASPFODRAFT_60781 [Aspergillus luchuensis CBS 106.47]|uniref:Proline racemase n=1 Tax=Aspergillus luchuensis (strain CBS 106.47) TaxID=1137211 RepID=A0A1M3TJA3_ASPLC|nr:hypothetical protein ASPFODRAFT_60781 [Aspergillus luchuensis CBS 106.47]
MRFTRSINVVGCHCAGEVCDVIVGGVLNPLGCSTMYEKLVHFRDKEDHIRQLLMQEPRGQLAMCVNLVLPPCNPKADAGFLIMETEEYPAMSGGNTIATTTVLLETGMVPVTEPVTKIVLETPAGLVPVTADCEGGKCKAVAFDNVPSFVFALDCKVDVPGLGTVSVDIAWGGMIYGINGPKLIEYGERIKDALQKAPFVPVHPENPSIRGVSILEFTEPLYCARMAVLHARGQLAVGERFQHHSIIGSTFECHIRGTQKLGDYDAVLPTVKGSAWINSFKQMVLDPTDPWPVGFRVGDQWHMAE